MNTRFRKNFEFQENLQETSGMPRFDVRDFDERQASPEPGDKLQDP